MQQISFRRILHYGSGLTVRGRRLWTLQRNSARIFGFSSIDIVCCTLYFTRIYLHSRNSAGENLCENGFSDSSRISSALAVWLKLTIDMLQCQPGVIESAKVGLYRISEIEEAVSRCLLQNKYNRKKTTHFTKLVCFTLYSIFIFYIIRTPCV